MWLRVKSGILAVYKPKNMTSRQVVDFVGNVFHTKKVGHTGTLDPLAQGVLVLGINQGTKIIELLMSSEKEYIADVVIGQDSDTLDVTGSILSYELDHLYSRSEVLAVLDSFLGTYDQDVPLYSAVHVDGKRLYEYARKGQSVDLPSRKVTVHEIELLSDVQRKDGQVTFQFRVVVSKGTYIRSLIRDIGRKLGCPCIMKDLLRVRQGSFSVDQTYKIEELSLDTDLIQMKEALQMTSEYDTVVVSSEVEEKIWNGAILPKNFSGSYAIVLNQQQELLAIYQTYSKNEKLMKPWKVFGKEDTK